MSQIQDLIDEGALLVYHDYRSGSVRDWSESGNPATVSGACWTNSGFNLVGADYLQVANTAALEALTEMTQIWYAENLEHSNRGQSNVLHKRDAGGFSYQTYIHRVGPVIGIVDSAAVGRTINANITGKRYVGINVKHTETPEVFIDGASIGSMTGVVDISANDAPIFIGNDHTGIRAYAGKMMAVMIVNRKLTAPEHAALYAELETIKWPKKPKVAIPSGAQYKESWGSKECAGLTSAGNGEILGTDWQIGTGTWTVSNETVDGKLCKTVECTVAGFIWLDANHIKDDPTEDAYGTWEWYAYKANASVMDILPVASLPAVAADGAMDGYVVSWAADEAVTVEEITNGAATPTTIADTASHSVWTKFKLTRSGADDWVLYIDGTSVGTDNEGTNTTSGYIVIDCDAGDKFCLSDMAGDVAFSKRYGVV